MRSDKRDSRTVHLVIIVHGKIGRTGATEQRHSSKPRHTVEALVERRAHAGYLYRYVHSAAGYFLYVFGKMFVVRVERIIRAYFKRLLAFFGNRIDGDYRNGARGSKQLYRYHTQHALPHNQRAFAYFQTAFSYRRHRERGYVKKRSVREAHVVGDFHHVFFGQNVVLGVNAPIVCHSVAGRQRKHVFAHLFHYAGRAVPGNSRKLSYSARVEPRNVGVAGQVGALRTAAYRGTSEAHKHFVVAGLVNLFGQNFRNVRLCEYYFFVYHLLSPRRKIDVIVSFTL